MIEKVIITSLVCTAIHVIIKPGMILQLVGEFLELFAHPFIAKPLGLCLPCMASFYGLLMFIFWSGLPATDFIPFLLAVIGLNFIIDLIISFIQLIIEEQNENNNAGRSETSGY